MPERPVKTKIFKKFLKSLGLKKSEGKGDHEKWDYPKEKLLRPIVFVQGEADIPPCHLRNNLKTLGVSVDDFWKWVNKK